MTEQKSLNDLLGKLINAAYEIIGYKVLCAKGEELPEDMSGYTTGEEHQEYIINLIKPLINKHEEVKEIEAHSSRDVLEMLNKGKISAKEAIELMSLMKQQAEVAAKELETKLTEDIFGKQ